MVWVDPGWGDPEGADLEHDILVPLLDHPGLGAIHLGNGRGIRPRARLRLSAARDERRLLAEAAAAGRPVLRVWRWGPWRLPLTAEIIDGVLSAHAAAGGGWQQTDLADVPFPYARFEVLAPEATTLLAARPGLALDWETAYLTLAAAGPLPFAMDRHGLGNQGRRQCLESTAAAPFFAFPKFVALEASRMCNLRCTMCVTHSDMMDHPTVQGHPKHFDLRHYKSILDELVPYQGFVSVCPQFQGEPLLAPDFPAMLDYAKAKGLAVGFTSNATLWDDAHITHFLQGRVDNIKVSIDGGSKETFEAIRIGAAYDTVVGAVEALVEARSRTSLPGKPYISLSMTVLASNRHEVQGFIERWLDRVDSVTLNNVCINDVVFEKNFEPPRYPCPFLWEGLHVLTNGDVVPCCRDNHYQEVMGNAFEAPLLDIWTNEKYRKFRQLHLDGRWDEIGICSRCDTWMVKTRRVGVEDGKVVSTFPFNKEYRSLTRVLAVPPPPPLLRRVLGWFKRRLVG